jgi:predicted RNA-binding Zn ribbon-like protein
MHLNPYGEDAVLFAVALLREPPGSAAHLTRQCRDAGVVVERPATRGDLEHVREFLDRWVEVVDATDERQRADLLNLLLARYGAHPRLTDHADTGWHVHYRDDDLALGDVVAALVSVGTALHLAGRGMHRLGRCVVPECRRVIADVSRTGRRRYCSPSCANRDAVRRHRARKPRAFAGP